MLYALFAVLVGAGLLSLVGARLMLRPATIRFRLPAQVSVGETISVDVAVVPQVWPSKRHLLLLKSPYPFALAQDVFLPVSGRSFVRKHRVLCTQRGFFRLCDATVTSAYPFGLAKLVRTWQVEPIAIAVYPRVYPGTAFSLPASSTRNSVDMEQPTPSLGQELFREVREYRRGDNPRHIHWRSSARHGSLVMKQFDAVATSETWIVLDLDPASHAGSGEDHTFERSLEIAASIATHQIRSGLRCGVAGGLGANGAPRILIAPSTGNAHLQALLEALAAVRADYAIPYATVLDNLSPHYRAGQQWILFKDVGQRVVAPAFLQKQRAPFWFRIDTDSFVAGDLSERIQLERKLLPPVRQSDGYAIGRDTDLSLLFMS